MAKKFGKFLLVTAAVASAAAVAHYYLQKKDNGGMEPEDDDYDDFSEDPETSSLSRDYVPLAHESKDKSDPAAGQSESKGDGFTPLKETAEKAAEKAEGTIENVEEFFDEEDESEGEPAITDK